jgi:hypothetical protein
MPYYLCQRKKEEEKIQEANCFELDGYMFEFWLNFEKVSIIS